MYSQSSSRRVSAERLSPRSDYFDPRFQRPRSDSNVSLPRQRSRFEEVTEPGLGIQMGPITSPQSPGIIHKTSHQPKGAGIYSPLLSSGSPHKYLNTPGSTTSFGSPFSRCKTDPMTEQLIQHRSTKAAEWKIHWRTPVLMFVSFLVGVLLAVGQHLLYRSLHRTTEDDEHKKFRMVLYGRALAYFSRVALGGCVILSFRQRIWRTFREQALSVWSIDQLFLATEDPSLFLNLEIITKAWLVLIMAMVIWIIPIATIIFSPGALTFGDSLERQFVRIKVPTLNFTAESYKDYRVASFGSDGVTKKKSLIFVNTTNPSGATHGHFDYYDQPSADIKRVSLISAYSLRNQSLNRENARLISCGGIFNCTYSISFVGPGYKCEVVAQGPGDDQKLARMGAPFNTSKLAPQGRNVYWADVDIGEYERGQFSNITGSGNVSTSRIPAELGVFKSEPVLWIGYSIDSNVTLPIDSPYNRTWKTRFDPYVFACRHYETNYTVKWNYTGPFFSTDVSYDFLSPIVDTNFTQNDGFILASKPLPVENYIRPATDPPRYKKTAAYHALGERLRYFLQGKMEAVAQKPGPFYTIVQSQIAMTRLVSNSSSMPLDNLSDRVQGFYTDMLLSLLSLPSFLVVSEEETIVHRTRFKSTFLYDPWKLLTCYAPVILLTFIFLVVGIVTIVQDGTTFSVGFSRIMVTTRNSTLDEISRGACLGNDPFPTELMHTRLKFGVLIEGGHEMEYTDIQDVQATGHCAFGVPSELTPVKKGVSYAGLQQPRMTKLAKMKVE